mmetsp:Transcript_31269/g.102410  ORF Transcript_31269/g.102410 Transcript_31269/m.102410 type:complete len:621 (-) Transcript_31269:684-2546(-)
MGRRVSFPPLCASSASRARGRGRPTGLWRRSRGLREGLRDDPLSRERHGACRDGSRAVLEGDVVLAGREHEVPVQVAELEVARAEREGHRGRLAAAEVAHALEAPERLDRVVGHAGRGERQRRKVRLHHLVPLARADVREHDAHVQRGGRGGGEGPAAARLPDRELEGGVREAVPERGEERDAPPVVAVRAAQPVLDVVVEHRVCLCPVRGVDRVRHLPPAVGAPEERVREGLAALCSRVKGLDDRRRVDRVAELLRHGHHASVEQEEDRRLVEREHRRRECMLLAWQVDGGAVVRLAFGPLHAVGPVGGAAVQVAGRTVALPPAPRAPRAARGAAQPEHNHLGRLRRSERRREALAPHEDHVAALGVRRTRVGVAVREGRERRGDALEASAGADLARVHLDEGAGRVGVRPEDGDPLARSERQDGPAVAPRGRVLKQDERGGGRVSVERSRRGGADVRLAELPVRVACLWVEEAELEADPEGVEERPVDVRDGAAPGADAAQQGVVVSVPRVHVSASLAECDAARLLRGALVAVRPPHVRDRVGVRGDVPLEAPRLARSLHHGRRAGGQAVDGVVAAHHAEGARLADRGAEGRPVVVGQQLPADVHVDGVPREAVAVLE